MKLRSAFPLCWIFIFLVVVGCKQEAAVPPPPARELIPTNTASSTHLESSLDWQLRIGRDSYRRGPQANKKWDSAASAALEQFALMQAGIPDSDGRRNMLIASNCTEAVKAGCNDPLVAFLAVRMRDAKEESAVADAMELADAAVRLNSSSYPAALKLETTLIALLSVLSVDAEEPPRRLIQELGSPLEYLDPMLADPNIPVAEAYRLSGLVLAFWDGTTKAPVYESITDRIHAQMKQRWAGDYRTWLLKGKAHTRLAWIHRGSGPASTVTEAGDEGFRANLTTAHESLEKAWSLNPSDVEIPITMLSVSLGMGCNGQARDLMELWFGRAMTIDPNGVKACRGKMYFLEPKWHGNESMQRDFGRQCVESTNWGGRVPLMLVEAHQAIVAGKESEREQLDYWKSDPGIWLDIQESFERFLESNPAETRFFAQYLLYAVRAERWDKVRELLPKVTAAQYDSLAGAAEYLKITKLAALRASKTPKLQMNLWVETNRMHDRLINRIDYLWTDDRQMRQQIADYDELLKKYPKALPMEKGNLLLKQAFVYEQVIRDPAGAKRVYERILKELPRSSATAIAQSAMRRLSNPPAH